MATLDWNGTGRLTGEKLYTCMDLYRILSQKYGFQSKQNGTSVTINVWYHSGHLPNIFFIIIILIPAKCLMTDGTTICIGKNVLLKGRQERTLVMSY